MSHTLEERCRQLMIQRKFEQCQKEIETAMAENPHCVLYGLRICIIVRNLEKW